MFLSVASIQASLLAEATPMVTVTSLAEATCWVLLTCVACLPQPPPNILTLILTEALRQPYSVIT